MKSSLRPVLTGAVLAMLITGASLTAYAEPPATGKACCMSPPSRASLSKTSCPAKQASPSPTP